MHFKTFVLLVSLFVVAAVAQLDGTLVIPKLRGIDKIGIGYDIVTARIMMSPVEMTWLGKYFTSPYDDKDYEIPMEIDSISTPDTFINRTVHVFNNVDEFREERGRSTGISFNLGNMFAFTNTKETLNIRFTQDNRNYRFGIAEQTHIFFDIKLMPPFLLKPSYPCQEFLKRLPRYTPATKAQYTQFFSYFGTHYVAQAQLGGTVRREELADIRNFTKLTEDFIHTQFAISFSLGTSPANSEAPGETPNNDPTAGVTPGQEIPTETGANTGGNTNPGNTGGDPNVHGDPSDPNYNGDPNANTDPAQGGGKKRSTNQRQIAITEETSKRGLNMVNDMSFSFSFNKTRTELKRQLQIRYSEHSHNITRLLGGNNALFEPDQWRDWVQTIPRNPVIIGFTLESIAELILNNPTMKEDMTKAIFDHNNTPR